MNTVCARVGRASHTRSGHLHKAQQAYGAACGGWMQHSDLVAESAARRREWRSIWQPLHHAPAADAGTAAALTGWFCEPVRCVLDVDFIADHLLRPVLDVAPLIQGALLRVPHRGDVHINKQVLCFFWGQLPCGPVHFIALVGDAARGAAGCCAACARREAGRGGRLRLYDSGRLLVKTVVPQTCQG